MRKLSTILFATVFTSTGFAQNVGHTAISFYDSSRDRDVPTEIYYPAATNGDDVPVSIGSFPLIVFGHGFVMPWSDYSNIWEFLVAENYVLLFLTTEGSFAPSHEDFGLDLSFVASAMMDENQNNNSLFYNSLTDKQAIMGHSMGGGATWLAAASNLEIETVVGLAPAETNPSAIEAAYDVLIPMLVISGSADAVTPPADHHTPIYENTASECKAFVNLLDGGHCGFAQAGICDFGELFFTGMSRDTQQEITHNLLLHWFNYFLKDELAAFNSFQTYCDGNSDTQLTLDCGVSVSENFPGEGWIVFPNPASEHLTVEHTKSFSNASLEIFDSLGKNVWSQIAGAKTEIDISHLTPGLHLIRTSEGEQYEFRLFEVVR